MEDMLEMTDHEYIVWDDVPWKFIPNHKALTNITFGTATFTGKYQRIQKIRILPSIILWNEKDYADAMADDNDPITSDYWMLNARVVHVREPMYE